MKKNRILVTSLLLVLAMILTSMNLFWSFELQNKVKDLPPQTFWTKERYVDEPIFVLQDDLEKLYQSMPMFRVEFELELVRWYWAYPPGTKFKRTMMGTGIVIGDYILTAGHLIEPGFDPSLVKINKREIFLGMPEDITHYQGPRGTLELIWAEGIKTVDLALLKLPQGLKIPSFPFALGDTDSNVLKTGKFIYAAGLPYLPNFLATPHLAQGNIANSKGSEFLANVFFPAGRENVFLASAYMYPGYSGGPVMAVTREGKLELVGIVQGTHWVTKIDKAFEVIERKTGINLMKEWYRLELDREIISQEVENEREVIIGK